MSQAEHVERAIRIAGSQAALAKAMGVSQQAVWKWLHEQVPLNTDRALDMEAATDGQVSRCDLRPDRFPRAERVVEKA